MLIEKSENRGAWLRPENTITENIYNIRPQQYNVRDVTIGYRIAKLVAMCTEVLLKFNNLLQ